MPAASRDRSSARRVRARRRAARIDPSVYTAPLPPIKLLTAQPDDLVLRSPSATFRLARALSSVDYELTMDGASTLTANVIDARDELLELLDASEDLLLDEGITATLGGVRYRLSGVSADGGSPLQLTLVDDVAWALQGPSSPLKFSRGQMTRAAAIYRFADDARQPPRAHFPIYIPEIGDRQPIAKAAQTDQPSAGADGSPGGAPGFSDADDVTVKGSKANALQRRVIGECLAEAHRLGASDRVLVVVVMCITQESLAGKLVDAAADGDNADDLGIYRQGREWVSAANAKKAAAATRAFLLGSKAAKAGGTGDTKGWRQRHGSLRSAPGDLDRAIAEVQISSGGYGPWETEAKRTVKAWDPEAAGAGAGERDYAKAFEFTRGTSDGRESSLAAIRRLTEEINQSGESWHYWIALNAFWYASDTELRRARPSLTVHTGAPYLLGRSFTWNANRPTTELTLNVLARDWGLQPASVVAVPSTWGPVAGRWLVRSVRGTLGTSQAEITLRRPVAKRPEPAHETASRDTGDESGGSGGTAAERLLEECKHISAQGRDYRYGGGHDKPLSEITPSEPLDCSSSVCLALKRAGLLKGDRAQVSGAMAASYGARGRGDGYTVWANGEHVWIEFDHGGRYKRFDTSPHGSGENGPRVRTTARGDQDRFTARHWRS